MTPPMNVGYDDLVRVWREADEIPSIEHAWLFDHLMPIAGDPNGPAFEGWTLLSALAAQTQRLRLGLLVTSNRFRPPAMLAKIAVTVDAVSRGRLDFGIGAAATLRVVARFADVWNFQGGDMADGARRSVVLDGLCTEIGRDPAAIIRSTNVPVYYDRPSDTRAGIDQDLDAGFRHIVLILPAPYPDHVAHWVTDQFIPPTN